MGELLAAMAANRMRTRQSYRTMARMQRRRSYMENRMGMRQDFEPAGQPEQQYAEPAPAAAPPSYTAELEQLAQLRDQGVITAEDFEAKKKQLLGI
ncbi:MAG: SHOCT domain-containing protein [Thermoleophilaceae bacterium]